jgi:predicted SAM-dependent methyltransferase
MADLFPTKPDIACEDITKLSFGDRTFDLVVANHVLEHVKEDQAAMSELLRVLKPGGLAVLQTPYSEKLANTFEDPGICDDESRLQAYGQEDHVRLYGRDLFAKLAGIGFIPKVLTHDTVLGNFDPVVYGVNRREPFMCMCRPTNG